MVAVSRQGQPGHSSRHCCVNLPRDCHTRLLAGLDKGRTGCNFVRTRPQSRPHIQAYLQSRPSFHLPALLAILGRSMAQDTKMLTNCQLHLGWTLARRREGSRDIGRPPAGPPSRTSYGVSEHRVALTE